jgi:hypothetical protein
LSEHAFIREHTWLERGFELLKSIAPYRRDYLLPAPSRRWLGTVRKLASYETAAAAGHALLEDLRRSNDDSNLLPSVMVQFYTEHSERATAPSILATLQIPKAERDLLGRWCPEGSDTYMRTYKTVVAKLQHKMAEALRSPTRFKDLEEHEIIPELVLWLRERAFLEVQSAEEVGETVAAIMKTSSYSTEWSSAAPTQLQVSQSQDVPLEQLPDSDEEEVSAASGTNGRMGNQYLLVSAAGKQGATLHNTDRCWMARSRSFTALEVRTEKPPASEYSRICKLCWPKNQLVQDQESSSSDGTSDDQGFLGGGDVFSVGADADSVHESEVLVEDSAFDNDSIIEAINLET